MMKVGLAQINGVVGDFPKNAKRILNAYRAAVEERAELVLTPELSLVGYPPRDLVFKADFVPKCLQALDYLSGEVGEVPLVVGYVAHHEKSEVGKPFRNAAAFLCEGKVQARVFKTLLPTYDVFDERRYYEPSEQSEVVEWKGRRFGITICEDIWTEEYLHRPLYKRDPVKDLCQEGIDVLLNLSASPFHGGKTRRRRELICDVAREYGVTVAYCNAVGGNDQLIFDGHSVVVDPTGAVISELEGFEERVQVVDLEGERESVEDVCDEQELYQALVLGLRDYAQKCGFQKACLGLSGGIDSALTAVIAAEALGGQNVHGLTMPSGYSSKGSIEDSVTLARNLGMRCDEVPIQKSFEVCKEAVTPVFDGRAEDVTEENMQARIRGLFLMSLSNKTGALLLTTGNKSELAVGYCTMYGDMCGGLAVISDVPKMQVYALAKWVNREREIIPWNTINKAPSAELKPDQVDQDTLPPYEVLDDILECYVEKQMSSEQIIAEKTYDEKIVHWVVRRVDLNEWKRYQAAPGLRVSSKAFGIGRRLPIAQNFSG